MNFKFLFFILFILFLFEKSILSDEININASEVRVLDEGNIISGLNVNADIPGKQIVIEGDKSIYDKKKNKLTIIKKPNIVIKRKNIGILYNLFICTITFVVEYPIFV